MDSISSIWKRRALYITLGKALNFHEGKINIKNFMIICEKIKPSRVIKTGGIFFENFILESCTYNDAKLLKQMILRKTKYSNDEINYLIITYSMKFWFNTLILLKRLNQQNNYHLTMINLYLDYRGLSRRGLELLSLLGVGISIRTNDRKKRFLLLQYENELLNLFKISNPIMAIDNYNGAYGNSAQHVAKPSQIALCNVTVCGLINPPKYVNNNFIFNDDNLIVPALPRVEIQLIKYLKSFINDLHISSNNINNNYNDESKYVQSYRKYLFWEQSRVVEINMNQVPSVGDIDNPDYGLKNYRPWNVLPFNTAANLDMGNIYLHLNSHYKKIYQRNQYGYLRVDVSIYRKLLQMIYDPSPLFNDKRFLLCPMLEYFHPFKHFMESIFRNTIFFKCFIAPYIHHYFPDDKVIKYYSYILTILYYSNIIGLIKRRNVFVFNQKFVE